MKIAFVDLETSGLDADGWNTLLCGVIGEYQPPVWKNGKLVKPPWANIKTFRREDYPEPLWEDKKLAKSIHKAIQGYDVTVSWNGIKFDQTFLTTRLREYGLSGLNWPRHKDLLYTARYKMRMSSNKLDNVARHLGVFEKYGVKKTELDRKMWRKAVRGDARAYHYVVVHCQEDIKVLAAIWEELKGLVTEIK